MRRATRWILGLSTAASIAGAAPARAQEPAESVTGVFTEPRFLARAIDIGLRTGGQGSDSEKSGVYPELSNMITGAGWIAGGPGYRHWLFGDRLLLDGSAAVSWRLYRMAQARAELTNLARSRIALGVQARWQDATQITYFGAGPSSLETDRSEYGLTTIDVAGFVSYRPARWLAVDLNAGRLAAPSVHRSSGSFRRGFPDTADVFPADPVFARASQPAYVHAGALITADTRNRRGHPTRGAVYRAAWARYDDRAGGQFTFDRYEAEAAQFIPVVGSRLVFAARGWFAGSDARDGRAVPFYLLPSIGGGNTLRGYGDYRFHDRHLAVVNAEARLALFAHLDAAVFADAGNVAARAADLNLDRRSYGVGVRLHTGRSTLARLELAHGGEGWRVVFRTADPLRLPRLTRRTAAAPFVP